MYVCVRACVCVCAQISSLKPLGQLKPNFTRNLHGTGKKVYLNGPGHLLLFIYIVNLRRKGEIWEREREREGGGAFSRIYNTCVPVVPGV